MIGILSRLSRLSPFFLIGRFVRNPYYLEKAGQSGTSGTDGLIYLSRIAQ